MRFVLSLFFFFLGFFFDLDAQEGESHFQTILGMGRACCCAPWGFCRITSLTKRAEAAASTFPEILDGFVLSHPGHQ